MPFLVRLVREIHNGIIALVCVLLICVARYVGQGPYHVIPYSAYAVLGMIVYRNVRCRSIWVGVIALVIIGLTAWNCGIVLRTGSFKTMGYCSPFILGGSSLLMCLVLNSFPLSFGGRAATAVSKLVYGVYLVHPIFKGVAMAAVGRICPS